MNDKSKSYLLGVGRMVAPVKKLTACQVRTLQFIARGERYYISGQTGAALVSAGVVVMTDPGVDVATPWIEGAHPQPWAYALTADAKKYL